MTSLLRVACLTALFSVALAASGKYDPCVPAKKASAGNGFYIGIAFWPGGTVDDWGPYYDKDTDVFGLNPCFVSREYNSTNTTDRAWLVQNNVVFATYELRTDSMTVLRINHTDTEALYDTISGNATQVITAVVFRGPIRSEARYIRSGAEDITRIEGIVEQLAIIAQFKGGQLQQFQWSDITCDSCHGRSSPSCLIADSWDARQYSCTSDAANCTITPNSTVIGNTSTDLCTPAIYFGFSGSDKYQRTFNSGYQIARINEFSLINFYNNALNAVGSLFTGVSTSVTGVASTPAVISSGDGSAA